MQTTHQTMLKSRHSLYVLIALMGFIGACLRYVLEISFPSDGIPYATLGINIAGCFVMEIINLYIVRRTHAPESFGRALGVGFVGAFTTLSAFSAEMLGLLDAGDYIAASIYLTLTFFLTAIAALAGRGVVALFNRARLARFRSKMRHNQGKRGRR